MQNEQDMDNAMVSGLWKSLKYHINNMVIVYYHYIILPMYCILDMNQTTFSTQK